MSTLVDRGILNISLGRSINHVSNLETLDGLILWLRRKDKSPYLTDATVAVSASDGSNMTSTLLGTTVISRKP